MAVKVVQLESLLEAKQAEQQAKGSRAKPIFQQARDKNNFNHSYVYTANGGMLLWLEWQ